MFDDPSNKTNYTYIPTGLKDLDYSITGWRKNKVYAIDGNSHSGKTSFLINAALTISQKEQVLFYSWKDHFPTVMERMCTAFNVHSGFNFSAPEFRDKSVNEIREILQDAALMKHQLFIKNQIPFSIRSLLYDLELEVNHNGIKWIIIDDIDLIANNILHTDRKFLIYELFTELKQFAYYNNCGIIFSRVYDRDNFKLENLKFIRLKDLKNGQYEHYGVDVLLYLSTFEHDTHTINYWPRCVTYLNVLKNYKEPHYGYFPIINSLKEQVFRDFTDEEVGSETREAVFKTYYIDPVRTKKPTVIDDEDTPF